MGRLSSVVLRALAIACLLMAPVAAGADTGYNPTTVEPTWYPSPDPIDTINTYYPPVPLIVPTTIPGDSGGTTKPKPSGPVAPTAAQLHVLRFTRTAATSRVADRGMATAFAGIPGFDRDAFLAAADAGKLRAFFRSLIAGTGWSASNLGDVFAAYVVGSWQIVNDVDTLNHTQLLGSQRFRSSLQAALARNPKVKRLSRASKQRSAETAATLIVLEVGQRINYVQAGDQASVDRLEAAVRQGARKSFGIDLGALELGASGFTRR